MYVFVFEYDRVCRVYVGSLFVCVCVCVCV